MGGGGGEAEVVVPLNDASPTLGSWIRRIRRADRRPRLEIAFGVNAERWLTASVRDLLTREGLMDEEPVVRLL